MAVGKSSLGRVAKSGANAEVAATLIASPAKETEKVVKAAAPQKQTKSPSNVSVKIGEALPVYLL